MSPSRRRKMVDREHPKLPIVRQCALLGVSRSSLYYRPKEASEADLSLMREMDAQHQCSNPAQRRRHPDGPNSKRPKRKGERVGWLQRQCPDGHRRGPSCHCQRLGEGHKAVDGPVGQVAVSFTGQAVA